MTTSARVQVVADGDALVEALGAVVGPRRALLAGEHELFGILCWARTDLNPDEVEGMLIFSHITYVTPGFKGAV